jgi:hypothetical protein
VGARATSWWVGDFAWNPLLFLGNPNFELIQNFGGAYLFQFNYTNGSIAFQDEFKNAKWYAEGWQAGFIGNGQGNVSLASDSEGLKMTAEAVYTASEWQYATYISRDIFVPNDSDVTLSFYLNATQGFNGRDTFAAVVSNIYGNQTFVITTPNGVYQNYQHSESLPTSEGFFTFEGNNSLSTMWRQAYNSSLPGQFVLQFVNWDFDGIQNVAYLSNVTVTATPAP